jgi:hypothetical protein
MGLFVLGCGIVGKIVCKTFFFAIFDFFFKTTLMEFKVIFIFENQLN